MWEILITDSKDKADSMELLFEKLRKEVCLLKGIIINDIFADRSRVCIAVPDRAVEYFRVILFDAVADIITLGYKYDYFLKNIRLSSQNQVANDAFLMALTVFDKQTDKDFIKQKLAAKNELNIDSFFHFRLPELKDRWQEISVLVTENLNFLVMTEGFFEMLRFLIKTTPVECEEVHLVFEDEKISLCNSKLESQKTFGAFQKNESVEKQIVNKLISLSPQTIVLHSEKNFQLIENLCSIFEDKVRIVPKKAK